jgi:DNA-binding CsgD family transcriptional regulator
MTAAGNTNAEIAERLVLSVRTIENHLARTFQKLGVLSRRELSLLLDHADVRPPVEPLR